MRVLEAKDIASAKTLQRDLASQIQKNNEETSMAREE